MAELIEHGRSFTDRERAVIIGAASAGMATVGAAGFAAVRALHNHIRARGELQ